MNGLVITGIAILLLLAGNVAEIATVRATRAELKTSQADLTTAKANQLSNGKSASAWETVAKDNTAALNTCTAEKATQSRQNKDALDKATATAQANDAKAAGYREQLRKALKGSNATLLNTPLPDEVLPHE